MEKLFSKILVLVFCMSLMLAGCSSNQTKDSSSGTDSSPKTEQKQDDSSNSKDEASKGEESNLTDPGTFPIVKEKVTLSVFMPSNSDMSKNWFTKYYEDKTNVHIDWQTAPTDQFKEKLNLMFASGDYADIIASANNSLTRLSKEEELKFGTQGIFLPLNDLIETQSVWYKKQLEKQPGLKEFTTAPDGNIYGFAQINDCFHCTYADKMWMNVKWLENLGLEVPTTTEEFYNVLKAFKEQDANGNGDPNDEIPLSTCKAGAMVDLDAFLMCPFTYTTSWTWADKLAINNGKIEATYAKPEYREGLKYLRKLYQEGLIYPESFTQDRDTQRNLNESGDVALMGAVPSMHCGYFSAVGTSDRWKEYRAIAPLKGPNGQVTNNYAYQKYQNAATVITTACEQPKVAFRLIDWFFSEEGTLLASRGAEGMTWRKAKEGEVGLDGRPAKWANLDPLPEDHEYYNNTSWGQTFAVNHERDFRVSWAGANDYLSDDPGAYEKFLYVMTETNYEPYATPLETVVPNMYYKPEVISEMAQIKTGIMDYVKESVARFITGDADLENDWDRYLKDLDNLGLQRYLEMVQEAYDSQYK